MGYIGNQPAERYSTMDKQTITGDGTVGPYTLDHSVGNEQEIEVFVNNVRQEPSVAYTVSADQLTMTGTVSSSDDFYVVFQGKATLTATHPSTFDLNAANGTFTGDLTVDTNTLHVDSTNNRVGVKTTSPSTALDVNGAVTADGLTVDGSVDVNDSNLNITSNAVNINLYENDTTDVNTRIRQSAGDLFIQTLGDTSGVTNRINLDHATGDISFYANDGTTQGLFWDASTQRLGLGTTSPVATLEVDGTTTLTGGGTGSIHVNVEDSSLCPTMTFTRNGAGTITNGFVKFENSGGQVAEINASGGGYFLGDVGIGTSSPSGTFHVVSSSDVRIAGTGNSHYTYFYSNSTTTRGSVSAQSTGLRVQSQSSGSLELFNTSNQGLRVNNNSRVDLALPNQVNGFNNGLRIHGNVSDYTVGRGAGLFFRNADVEVGGILGIRQANNFQGALTFYTHNNASGNTFGTTYTEKMRIDSSGNVGIGTTSPAITLDTGYTRVYNSGAASSPSAGKGLEIHYVTSGRTQGEGAYLISYDRDNSAYKQFAVDANNIELATSGTTKLSILSNGNVGIGTTSPGKKLDVDGDIKINGLTFQGDSFTVSCPASTATTVLDLTSYGRRAIMIYGYDSGTHCAGVAIVNAVFNGGSYQHKINQLTGPGTNGGTFSISGNNLQFTQTFSATRTCNFRMFYIGA